MTRPSRFLSRIEIIVHNVRGQAGRSGYEATSLTITEEEPYDAPINDCLMLTMSSTQASSVISHMPINQT